MTRLLPAAALAVLVTALSANGSAASDAIPLADQTEITDGLIAAAIAWEIGEGCDSIDARMLRGAAFLAGLHQRARQMGYSDAEIRSFMDDSAQKARLEAEAWQRFAELGGVRGEPATYCAVGREQIAAGTQIGNLLR
ncbi:MAG: DUF5333 domain-containing protein [Rubellimicrobium sp.]|nr:DUF5333 domain-containing protein [Rubellimicrobium sp.]